MEVNSDGAPAPFREWDGDRDMGRTVPDINTKATDKWDSTQYF